MFPSHDRGTFPDLFNEDHEFSYVYGWSYMQNDDESFFTYKIGKYYSFAGREPWRLINLKNIAGIYGSYATREEAYLAAKEYFK